MNYVDELAIIALLVEPINRGKGAYVCKRSNIRHQQVVPIPKQLWGDSLVFVQNCKRVGSLCDQWVEE